MTELQEALKLAEKLLDEPNCDPDDDLRMLARQLLRRQARVEQLQEEVDGYGMRDLITANRDAILKKHEEAFTLISNCINQTRNVIRSHGTALEQLIYIEKVLHALAMFHPMHGESWEGWPKT